MVCFDFGYGLFCICWLLSSQEISVGDWLWLFVVLVNCLFSVIKVVFVIAVDFGIVDPFVGWWFCGYVWFATCALCVCLL